MMEELPNINIERAVISAIIFDPIIMETIAISSNDFYHPFNQKLFTIFKELELEEKPIDEEFIKAKLIAKNAFNEVEMLDILATNPISNINAYAKVIKDATSNANYERRLKTIIGSKKLSAQEKSEAIKDATEKFEINTAIVESITLADLVQEEVPVRPKYETGIKFLDDVFGGFELGQLVTVTGSQETGKTQLINQILLNVAKGHKCLTFSLEFNRAKLQAYMKVKQQYNLSNIHAITQEMVTGDIDEICKLIHYNYKKNGTKFVTIDSQIMLFDESKEFMTAENEITSFYRKLHRAANTLDIIIFIIATKSLSSNSTKSRGIEIFGSKKASHFADIQLDLSFQDEDRNSENTSRDLWIAKNKQNGIHTNIELDFNEKMLEFIKKGKGFKIVYEESNLKKDTRWNETLDITIEDREQTAKEKKQIEELKRQGFDIE